MTIIPLIWRREHSKVCSYLFFKLLFSNCFIYSSLRCFFLFFKTSHSFGLTFKPFYLMNTEAPYAELTIQVIELPLMIRLMLSKSREDSFNWSSELLSIWYICYSMTFTWPQHCCFLTLLTSWVEKLVQSCPELELTDVNASQPTMLPQLLVWSP